MNEKMLKVLVTDSYLDNSVNGISKFEYIYKQQTNIRVENNQEVKEEVINVISRLENIGLTAKVAGSFRRNNLYLDELTFLVVTKAKRDAIKQCCEQFTFEVVSRDRASRIIKIGPYYLFELFIFVTERDYLHSLIKYTGSSEFYRLYKDRVKEIGLRSKPTTEQEAFELLEIPYLSPEIRDCVDDLTIPYSSFIVSKSEKISGNLIPFTKLSELKEYQNGYDFIGVYFTPEEFNKVGVGIFTLLRSIHIENVIIYVGIKLNNILQYSETLYKEFDFVMTGINVENINDFRTLKDIRKPIIVNSFGVSLANPLRTVLCRTNWEATLKGIANKHIPIAIDCNNLVDGLHPQLLNTFRKNGGEILLYNSHKPEFSKGLHLLRKALISRKSLIHNHFRLRKMMEGQNGRTEY